MGPDSTAPGEMTGSLVLSDTATTLIDMERNRPSVKRSDHYVTG